MRRSVAILMVGFMSLCLASATAQERKGSISGRITDSSQAILQGARIELEPSGPKAVSDSQGQFTIYGVAPGHYKVTVS